MRRLCSLTVNKRLAVVGCSLHEYAVLFRLVHEAEVPQHELAYDAAIDPAAVSRLVHAMARSGFVTTRVDPTDKRQRFVKLTPKGRTLERTLSPVVDAALRPLLSGLTPAEEQQFVGLLRKSYRHAATTSAALDAREHTPGARGPSTRARPTKGRAARVPSARSGAQARKDAVEARAGARSRNEAVARNVRR